ncbi:hypothetical protein BN000_03679 [Neobacillus massiliamazoniensis]|jgi:hypothetical protein|uniref:Uncharacterized protein n=1 Tax=Neobacillus massiliamazoniensis TaxID=1499688 RepID=A0A0U1P0Q2_9BACI|nr:hypothetical protein BN000_03679 [Neobacillus massiliamazoniensis]
MNIKYVFLDGGGFFVDKVTCIAYLLYQSTTSQDIREKAIQLLNGDVSIRELKKNASFQPHLVIAESLVKQNKIDKYKVQIFAEEFMLIEV